MVCSTSGYDSPGGRFEVELEGTGIMFAWKKVLAKIVVRILSSQMALPRVRVEHGDVEELK